MKLQILKEGFNKFLTELAASTFFSYIQKAATADGTYDTNRLKSLFDVATKAPNEFTLFNVDDPGKAKADIKFLLKSVGHTGVTVEGDAWSNQAGGGGEEGSPFPKGELVLHSPYKYKSVNKQIKGVGYDDAEAGGNADLELKIVVGRQLGEVSELIHGYELSLTWQSDEVGVLASQGESEGIRPKSSTISIDAQGKVALMEYVQGALNLMKDTRGGTLKTSGADFIPTGKVKVIPQELGLQREGDNI